ncbi:DNA-binding NarL/FixJ family response regulator [Methanomicrobium sp. W14]|uniref:ATP-binding response regulator n=1 Tax=Methanomicrobium sp. W14 TaxID=2817839 RepID=UPI001AE6E7B8|nr:response regulator [Methanomicrobium sp. W14]MBP2133335.1 DNA-binding NarL/FixJ family response regulator [Methanomicrobium sp. W14]
MADAKVLIVEDEIIVAMGIERSLSSFGYNVVGLAVRGNDAVRMTGELIPDIALIDIDLKDKKMDGVDVAKTIGERWDIPVVYLTSYADEDVLSRAIRANPYGYLIKPARPREVYTTIETVLQKHRTVKAERAMKSGEKKFHMVMDSIPFPICLISSSNNSPRHEIVFANKSFLDIVSVEISEIIHTDPCDLFGQNFLDNLHESKEKNSPEYDAVLYSGDGGIVQGRVFAKDVEYDSERLTLVIFREKNGGLVFSSKRTAEKYV